MRSNTYEVARFHACTSGRAYIYAWLDPRAIENPRQVKLVAEGEHRLDEREIAFDTNIELEGAAQALSGVGA